MYEMKGFDELQTNKTNQRKKSINVDFRNQEDAKSLCRICFKSKARREGGLLLNTIVCKCNNGYGLRCGCRKSELQCFLTCGQCNGQTCLNVSPYQNDLDEDSTFDPEILEDLETNILHNEYDDIELEIFERPPEDDDEEEKEN
ncbi:hypothetical protein FQA39_LY00644 [Lamprigera yunnana]|nr:hypothetical protein FQA39_LY00644 [Lamprigera yunnana]